MEVIIIVKVKNLNGTSNRRPPYGYVSWKDWWEKQKGRKFYQCSKYLCTKKAEVGAHVQKDYLYDRRWYIVPLCPACNLQSSSVTFHVKSNDLELIHK